MLATNDPAVLTSPTTVNRNGGFYEPIGKNAVFQNVSCGRCLFSLPVKFEPFFSRVHYNLFASCTSKSSIMMKEDYKAPLCLFLRSKMWSSCPFEGCCRCHLSIEHLRLSREVVHLAELSDCDGVKFIEIR